jgi:hypothetical protein
MRGSTWSPECWGRRNLGGADTVHVMALERQCDLFQLVLEELATRSDLVNQALEVFEQDDGSAVIEVYDIPEPD